ncbi:MAG: MBL fold metallo-hydrolase RNA specificity domain-containing protein, partial [Desulfobaccales bacterium]
HLITVNEQRILLDCGLYEGKRDEARRRNRELPFAARTVDMMVLSHAHIDHSGNIPNLVKHGFRGKVVCTEATADLCRYMLPDSGHIQEEDVEYVNRHRARNGEPPVDPIYTREDAVQSLRNFEGIGYDQPYQLAPGVTLTLYDAGHVLGSAIVALDFQAENRRLVYTGDLGRPQAPLLRDPTVLPAADALIIESTYGGRTHPPREDSEARLKETIQRTAKRGGKVIIPSFAVERTQFLVFLLHKLYEKGLLPDIPIYVDSPLAVDVTEVFRRHTDYFDDATQNYLAKLGPEGDIFGFHRLQYIRDVEESKKLHTKRGPCVIISASGMAEAGRIQHHLKNNIEDRRNTILIVGWQAPNTLGRRLVEQAPVVRIFGVEYHRQAEVVTLNGFSNHADEPGLLGWAQGFKPPPKRTFVVHGDPDAAEELATRLRRDLGFPEVMIPSLHQTVEI